jgi:hypothetical protein
VISNIVLNTYMKLQKGMTVLCSRCGGMIRDDNDVWVSGFIKNLGQTTAYMIQIWGV